jgi:predicted DCC family thiol-disulfide oxidoreductase YuxK
MQVGTILIKNEQYMQLQIRVCANCNRLKKLLSTKDSRKRQKKTTIQNKAGMLLLLMVICKQIAPLKERT